MWFLLYLACLTTKHWFSPAQQLVQMKYIFRQIVAKQQFKVSYKEGSGNGRPVCTSKAFHTLDAHL